MKTALIHDRLNVYAGSEKVLGHLHDLFPDSTVYTSISEPSRFPSSWKNWDIRTTGLQRLPLVKKHHQLLLPLLVFAFEQLELSDYDLVISSSHCAAKAVITDPGTFHLCYCHTPLRFAWTPNPAQMLSGKCKSRGNFLLNLMMHWIRLWDYASAARVDHFVANSKHVRARIKKHYRRDASVVYPGVDTQRFSVSDEIDDYYLLLSRLTPYKRTDLAVEAFNRLNRRLIVIGSGSHEKTLRKMAGPNVEIRGSATDAEVTRALSRCKALIFPGEEDFGIVPVEAQASGRPVIAYGRGGATETVIDGETGVLFPEQTADSLCDAVLSMDSMNLDPSDARRNAERFSIQAFRDSFISTLNQVLPKEPEPSAGRSKEPAAYV